MDFKKKWIVFHNCSDNKMFFKNSSRIWPLDCCLNFVSWNKLKLSIPCYQKFDFCCKVSQKNCRIILYLERPFQRPFFSFQQESQFYLYALYNKNKPKSDMLMAEYGKVFFKDKQAKLGDKMDLGSYLLKPVQRMGKYALLLKQIMKECPPTDQEYQDLRVSSEAFAWWSWNDWSHKEISTVETCTAGSSQVYTVVNMSKSIFTWILR